MLCEIDEAFVHNSCKKTAQLVKVITTMTNKHIESLQDRRKLLYLQDSEVNRIYKHYIKEITNVYENLVLYRKETINKECIDYGNKYKTIKNKYSEECNDFFEELHNLAKEIRNNKNIVHDLLDFTVETNQKTNLLPKKFFDTVKREKEACEREIKESSHKNTIIFNDKAKSLKTESRKNINSIKSTNNEIITSIRKEIEKVLAKEIKNRIPVLQEYKSRIVNLEKGNKSLKESLKDIHVTKRKTFQESIKKRDLIVGSTIKEYKLLNRAIQSVKTTIKSENKNYDRASSSLVKELCEQKKKHNNILSKLQIEINDLIRAQNSAASAFSKRKEEKSTEDNKMLLESFEKYKNDILSLKDKNKKDRVLCKEKVHKKRLIFRKIHANNGDNVENLKFYSENFISNLRDTENKFVASYNMEEKGLSTVLNTKIEQYKQFNKIEKNASNATREMITNEAVFGRKKNESQKRLLEEEENSLISKNAEKLNEAEQKYNKNLLAKKKEWEEKIEMKNEEQKKSIASVKKVFSNDLNEKKASIEQANLNKQVINEKDNKEEETKHEKRINQKKRELGIIESQCESSKKEKQRFINILNDQIGNLDKKKRQHERAALQSKQMIIEDFETSIQVLQVELNDKIDNISALYNEEENKRGIEIMQLKGKIQHFKNRTDDLIKDKENKIEEIKKHYKDEMEKVQNEIDKISNHSYEEKLIKQIEENEKIIAEKEREYEENTEKLCEKMKEDIEEESKRIETEKNEIKEKIESVKKEKIEENQKVSIDTTEFCENNENEKKEIEREYSVKIKKVEMKKKESLKILEDLKEKQEKEIEEMKEKYEEEYNLIWKPYQDKINGIKQKIEADQSLYDEKMKNAEDSQLELIINLFNPKIKEYDISKAKEKIEEAACKLEDINVLFFNLFDTIEGKNVKKVVEPPESTRLMSSRRVKRKTQK